MDDADAAWERRSAAVVAGDTCEEMCMPRPMCRYIYTHSAHSSLMNEWRRATAVDASVRLFCHAKMTSCTNIFIYITKSNSHYVHVHLFGIQSIGNWQVLDMLWSESVWINWLGGFSICIAAVLPYSWVRWRFMIEIWILLKSSNDLSKKQKIIWRVETIIKLTDLCKQCEIFPISQLLSIHCCCVL